MEPQTRAHLDTAARNRDIAYALLDPVAPIAVRPPPLDWALVAAFYAAVHYVNAYLWERQRYEPRNHDAREAAVARAAALRASVSAYAKLRQLAYLARYTPGFQPSRAEAQQALGADLVTVERVVLTALNVAT